jgi:Carboxypeptidase regulatory-like domain/TonB dependent receptor/TonB-dependent Receptor Plug Domain
MSTRYVLRGCWIVLLLASALLPARRLAAQTSTGNIRGVVTDSAGAPLAAAQVVALNTSTGVQRDATTNPRGFYSLSGLTPAPYQITVRHIGNSPVQRPAQLQVGQVLTLDFRLATTTVQLQEVVVQGAAAPETQTSEVATNVTQEQIQSLPSGSRNFLDLATLAPSVRVNADRINGTGKTFAAGALPAENINVFIDGKSLKNDIINGGVIGQDASRGNPFPRNAVQEFRIITNNFKAEYQKSSSAIITAVTKSGGNEWHGSFFGSLQNKGLVALDTFQRADRDTAASFTEPDYSRVLAGGSVGGPLIHDRLFLFAAYEGNFQNRQGVTRFNGDPAIWPSPIVALNGERATAPFRSHLGFAKLTYSLNREQQLEVSGNLRIERDRRSFGGLFSTPDRSVSVAENFRQNIADGSVKHTFFGRDWTNEALAYYQWYQWNPIPLNPNDVGIEFLGIGRIGGRDSEQNLIQKRLSFRDDWTYSGLQWGGSHVIKIGANLDFLHYDLHKDIFGNPVFRFSDANGFAFPVEAEYGVGDPDVNGTNNQVGGYLQDDWSPVERFTVNAGIRWDYESGMTDKNFVTPAPVRDSILTLRDSFFINVDPARYLADGSNRKAFTGAFQPRLGFSYALDQDRRTTIFAAGGIFYDRVGFNNFIDETYRRQHPQYLFRFSQDGSVPGTIAWDPALMSKQGLDSILALGQAPPQEVFLVPNDLKPPKTYQWNVGIRQLLGPVLTSVAYTGARGRNGYSYEWAQLTLNPATNDCCISISTPAYRNILVGNNDVHTWYDALEFRVDRTYRPGERIGWGAGIAYTLSWADQEGVDLFSFPQVRAGFNVRHPIPDDQRHRIVANWVLDLPWAFGTQFSGLATFASGKPFNRVVFVPLPPPGGNQRVLDGRERGPWFKTIDLRLRKDFPSFGGTRLGVTADFFNILNSDNLGNFDDVAVSPGGVPNINFGHAREVVSDPRRFQLGVQYDF